MNYVPSRADEVFRSVRCTKVTRLPTFVQCGGEPTPLASSGPARAVFSTPWPGMSSNKNSCLHTSPSPRSRPISTCHFCISRHQVVPSSCRYIPGLLRGEPVIRPRQQRGEGASTRSRTETGSMGRSRAVVNLLASDVSFSEQRRGIQSRAKRVRGRIMSLAAEYNQQQRPIHLGAGIKKP